jgi:hypothetical protein
MEIRKLLRTACLARARECVSMRANHFNVWTDWFSRNMEWPLCHWNTPKSRKSNLPYQVTHPVIQCSLEFPSPDFSRFCFVRADALQSRSFLCWVHNSAEVCMSVCTRVFETLQYFLLTVCPLCSCVLNVRESIYFCTAYIALLLLHYCTHWYSNAILYTQYTIINLLKPSGNFTYDQV